jgi:ribosome recycling factor
MINQLADKARKKMDDTLGSLKRDLDSISTGRASPNLLDTVRVEVYGQFMPISQLANVSVPEATTLSIQVWDRENVRAVEKAITNSNLGFNPAVDGTLLRISIPKLRYRANLPPTGTNDSTRHAQLHNDPTDEHIDTTALFRF